MVNNEEFSKRLQKIIDYYGENGSSFALKIGVQRSTISHILSGRNKPSLEFVLKVLSSFPEVELYWLINGKGVFPSTPISKENINQPEVKNNTDLFSSSKIISKPETNSKINIANSSVEKQKTNSKEIERIVIFYTDGSFKNFENS